MIRVLIPFLLIGPSTASFLSEITSYAKVSRNGGDEKEPGNGALSWITRAISRGNSSEGEENEGRAVKDIVITVSPVYVAPKTQKLQNGEALDYPSTRRYSTLDHQMLARLEAAAAKKQIQERYHPAPFISPNAPQSNNNGRPSNGKPASRPVNSENSDTYSFPKPPLSGVFEYKPPEYLSDKPASKPISMDDYPNGGNMNEKPRDSYKSKPETYYVTPDNESDFPDYPPDSSYHSDAAPKPIEFTGHLDHPPYGDDPYDHNHEFHQDVIYDHVPEYHDHHQNHHHDDHTDQPEMNDQRLDKRPYSYYFIGKKLWYVPLYFSIYFIIYIAALVLKSIARHKINFPSHLAEVAGHGRKYGEPTWWELAGRVLEGIENFADKFGRVS